MYDLFSANSKPAAIIPNFSVAESVRSLICEFLLSISVSFSASAASFSAIVASFSASVVSFCSILALRSSISASVLLSAHPTRPALSATQTHKHSATSIFLNFFILFSFCFLCEAKV